MSFLQKMSETYPEFWIFETRKIVFKLKIEDKIVIVKVTTHEYIRTKY